MLLPAKHIKLSESLIGLSGFVLERLDKPRTVDALWSELGVAVDRNEYPAYHSFENLVLALGFLYSIDLIQLDDSGKISR
jgi:hypothetical protein